MFLNVEKFRFLLQVNYMLFFKIIVMGLLSLAKLVFSPCYVII